MRNSGPVNSLTAAGQLKAGPMAVEKQTLPEARSRGAPIRGAAGLGYSQAAIWGIMKGFAAQSQRLEISPNMNIDVV